MYNLEMLLSFFNQKNVYDENRGWRMECSLSTSCPPLIEVFFKKKDAQVQ